MIKPFGKDHPKIHETAFVADGAIVIGDVEIGEEASIWFGSVLRGDVNHIRIGARTNIQDHCVLHVNSGDQPTILESEVTVGHRVTLHGCYVEQGSLVGIGSILLDGVRIGRNSLIGAGSLVTPGTIIPPGSLALGAPARVKRPLTEEELVGLTESWKHYVALRREYLAK